MKINFVFLRSFFLLNLIMIHNFTEINHNAGVSEARRHPKIIQSIHNAGPQLKKKEFEYNEYEYPTINTHQVIEGSDETNEREHDQQDQRDQHEHHEHHEHHESFLHAKHIPLGKKPGYSAGSGLRSIAQGSADQASSAVNNQVWHFVY